MYLCATATPRFHIPFGILFVSTHNTFRSALAEILTRRLLDDRLGLAAASFGVSSAGVRAVPGAPLNPNLHTALAENDIGAAARAFRARPLGVGPIAEADLVLTMGRESHHAVVELAPRMRAKTFYLLGFGRLLARPVRGPLPIDPVRRARTAVRMAGRRRGAGSEIPPGPDELPDPVDQTVATQRYVAEQITTFVHRLVVFLTATVGVEPQRMRHEPVD
ncbi:arsenate reductase/protein-tyrosine-phosphatase family protein [Actinophytocola gossypii]|uniref:Phosphotyrosine protein phosphatase I domain-containing protein n=1 Tax=Actinophytocola gossypii TaxID=2812003 RepID=A0ABT2J9N0_9PSEU|nr:hypothetical protein [Actinophytocola gossypii]MCT2584580.1 hypothetical protein [Actinophytocola gossypii]